jgi:hypothetical protein
MRKHVDSEAPRTRSAFERPDRANKYCVGARLDPALKGQAFGAQEGKTRSNWRCVPSPQSIMTR